MEGDEEPPPLAHFLRAIDQAQMESLPSVNKDSVGVQEALRSFHRAEQVQQAARLEEERQKAESKVESYPAFLTIQAPPPDYVEEVRERRLRLMAQEKARRQARKLRGSGYVPSEAPDSTNSNLTNSQPSQVGQKSASTHGAPGAPVSEYAELEERYAPTGDFAERAAEAAFAARVARVAREHPGAVGQRQSHQPVSPPRERLGRNDDFSGIWTDDAGNDYELVQSGSVVTERSQQSCGMAMRNELTMFGRIGTLVDDLIRWSDGSIWARQLPSGATGATGATSSGADLRSLGGFGWKAAARRKAGRLAPELAELFSPGPDVASAEWEDTAAQVAGTRREGRAEGSEQRLWFAPWVQDGKQGM